MKAIGENRYKWLLIIALCVFMIGNLYSIFISRKLLSVIGIFFQATVIVSIFNRWKYQEILVKIWATINIITGVAGIIFVITSYGMYLTDRFSHRELPNLSANLSLIIMSLFFILVGFYFYQNYLKNSNDI
jgi:hypothetical protein